MTPTEQDNELRSAIIHYRIKCDYYLSDRDEGVISQEEYETAICSELNAVIQLCTADRKRVALEARIDERQMLSFHRAYGRDYQATLETLEEANDERIAELKAQQEEVDD